jgi:hypothetical protein
MNLVGLIVVTLVVAGLAVGGILFWASRRVKAQQQQESQQQGRKYYMDLAAQAASDASGRSLVTLLEALETAPPDCPVTVGWVRHQPGNKPAGMLVRITWDGNEWRRVMEWAGFREQLRAHVDAHPQAGGRVHQLLAELEATP